MTSKTPQFDRALDTYFFQLKLDTHGGPSPRQSGFRPREGGQWRTCRFSNEKFYIRPEDVEFYKKIRVPLPTLSPLERSRRRMAFVPSYNFYRVQSASTHKPIISTYPPGTPFQIYEHGLWFSDVWDPLNFGKSYDPRRPFFEQFQELQRLVPRPNLFTDTTNINSPYTNGTHHLKNSYMTFDAAYGENQYYCEGCPESKDCVDCWVLEKSERCYKAWGGQLYQCIWCHYCFVCLDSYFLYDCTNCEHCFMCSNLRNKKYCFYNQQLTREEYEERVRKINLGNYDELQKYLHDFEILKQNAIRKGSFNEHAINSVGDWVIHSRDCFNVLFAVGCEQVAHSQGVMQYRDSYDCLFGCNGQLCYEFVATSMAENNSGNKFSSLANNSRDLEYCDLCYNCHDCYGCVGLRNKSFCVFNVQYTQDGYWENVDRIKTAMLEAGEYGEFFPPALSSFPYNASPVTNYQGYDNFEEARGYGYWIAHIPHDIESALDAEVVPSSKLPVDIRDTDDSILKKVILDEESNKKFRITPYELEFYRTFKLALPRLHPFVRMNQWRKDFDLRLRFFERPCSQCGKRMQTIYAPDRREKNIYCDECYQSVIA